VNISLVVERAPTRELRSRRNCGDLWRKAKPSLVAVRRKLVKRRGEVLKNCYFDTMSAVGRRATVQPNRKKGGRKASAR